MGNTVIQFTELLYIAGTSDKFYRVFADAAAGETFTQYGRNGTIGVFTARKPSKNVAEAAASQVGKNEAKGYRRSKSGAVEFAHSPSTEDLDTAVQGAPIFDGDAPASAPIVFDAPVGFVPEPEVLNAIHRALNGGSLPTLTRTDAGEIPRPMLAENVSPGQLHQMLDGAQSADWVTQFKLDGERCVVHVVDGEVIVLNRQGEAKQRNVSETMIAPFRNITEGVWTFDGWERWPELAFDGEIVGRDLVRFYMIRADRYHDESDTFRKRRHNLTVIAGHLAGVSVLGYATGGYKAAKRER